MESLLCYLGGFSLLVCCIIILVLLLMLIGYVVSKLKLDFTMLTYNNRAFDYILVGAIWVAFLALAAELIYLMGLAGIFLSGLIC